MASLLPQDNVPLAKPPLSSSSNSPSNNPLFPMSKTSKEKSKLVADESDDDLFMVPDMEAQKTIHELLDKKDDEKEMNNNSQEISKNEVTMIQPKRKRGRNAVDKEYRRLKRLLRNRVSAQQARERKKVYVNDLEWRAQELQDHNFKLEEKISTLLNENTMLRKILMNTRPKLDECAENKSLIDGGDRPSSDIH